MRRQQIINLTKEDSWLSVNQARVLIVDGPKRVTLSPQQQRVLALVAEGKTNKEIGSVLELSDKTVKNYVRAIFQKLKVTRRAHAAALFIRELTPQDRPNPHSSQGTHTEPPKSR